ncbi:MAG: MATE family efflux transporter, partial [Candidatus Gastranaerophilaceae bacterium]
ILKGLKMKKSVTICVLLCYWLVGIPLGFYLAYIQNMSLKGFWLGLTLSLFLLSILESIIIFTKTNQLKNEYQ